MTHGWWHRNAPRLFDSRVNWSRDFSASALYEPRSKSELHQRAVLDAIIPWHPFTIYDNEKRIERSLDYSGFGYEDILYPSDWSGPVSSGASQTLNFLSKNIEKLYKNW